jgi:hypothetical protein
VQGLFMCDANELGTLYINFELIFR